MVSAARGLPRELARVGPEVFYEDRIRAPSEWRWWRMRFQRLWVRLRNAFRPGPPYGQVVRVERVGGPDSLRVLAALTQSGGEAVLVDWLLTGSCTTGLRESRQPWLVPGERVFVTATLRGQAGWVDGRPTFDVRATEFPYSGRPHWFPNGRLGEPGLSLDEYWRLYEALPAHRELELGSATALAPLQAWQRAHPELMTHPRVRRELEAAGWHAWNAPEQNRPNRR
jgi:hypothetical protein